MPKRMPGANDAAPAPSPLPIWRRCVLCSEKYDEVKDPYHLENCREAQRP